MRKTLFKILLTGLIIFSLVGCNDDDVVIIDTEVEIEGGKDFMNLARIGGEYKIDIQTESNATWKASVDDALGYVAFDDTTGIGSKTITLYTSTNRYDEDRTANLCITFPGYEESNRVIPLKQMGKFSDPENADQLTTGNHIYAVGYGYDTRDKWANPNSVKAEILRTSEMIRSGNISAGSVELSVETDVVTGSSITELSNELNVSANVSGGGWGFKGEAGTSFKMKDFSSNKYEYAIAYINFAKRSVKTDRSAETLRSGYMTPEAYKEINGINANGERADELCGYPSTESGFEKLINAYGTHLVIKAKLGGQIKYAMRMDVSQIKGSYDLNAYAKMNYKGIVDADASVSDDLKKSFENNKSSIHTTISVLGGDDDTATNIAKLNKTDDVTQYFDSWMESLKKDENLALMDFDASDAMIPLYEMVDKAKYPERYEAMKQYMKTVRLESIKSINMEYQCGTSTMIEGLPAFDDSSEKNTLIKDVYNEGQWVGRICNEYIPVINKKARVTIVYPVFSNTVKYNMGYFVGDAGHAPAKVCWQGENLTVTECSGDSIGAKMTLYLRGSDISAVCYDNHVKGKIEDAMIAAQGWDGAYNYPIVKIFNQIWMRENYKSLYTSGYQRGWIEKSYYGDVYYSCYDRLLRDIPTPKNWRIPNKEDFELIGKVLEKNGVTEINISKAFSTDANGGILGFHNDNLGLIRDEAWTSDDLFMWSGEDKGSVGYFIVTSGIFKISDKNNIFTIISDSWKQDCLYPIRLVEDITQ